MNADEIKGVISQIVAGLALLGSLGAVYILVRDGIVSGDAGLAVFSTIIVGSLAYLTGAKASDQTQKAFAAGLAATPNGK